MGLFQRWAGVFARRLRATPHFGPKILAAQWRAFSATHGNLREYQKPYKPPSELVDKLVAQKLSVLNPTHAAQVIYHQNYFRLKAYFIPFLKSDKKFIDGKSFADIEAIYIADQKIRMFIFTILADLEVRFRSVLDNVVVSKTNNPFWHLDPSFFLKFSEVEKAITKAGSRFQTSRQEFALHYKNNYFNKKSFDFRLVPPFWIISEIFTLEQLLCVAKNIDRNKFAITERQNTLNKCATKFGFSSYETLLTNISCILEMRNICAHHSRLWNKNLRAPSGIGKLAITAAHPNRLYSQLVMLRRMCVSQGIADEIKPFFLQLFAATPMFQKSMASMGFPQRWETHAFWV